MSVPGPKPLPTKVHFLRGNPSKKSDTELKSAVDADVELPKCPPHLLGEARKEYKRIGEELQRYGLVSKLDRGVLAMMCTEWARYVWAEEKIAELNKQDPNGEKGLIDISPNGYRAMSAYLIISGKSMERYKSLATEFGLTPSSRTRVAPQNPQLGLPGIEQPPGAPSLSLASFL